MFTVIKIVVTILFLNAAVAAESNLLSQKYIKDFEKELTTSNLKNTLVKLTLLKNQTAKELKSELKKKEKNKALIFELIQFKNALALIEEKNFDTKNCAEYKNHFIFSYEPQNADDKPALSLIAKRVYGYLEKICNL